VNGCSHVGQIASFARAVAGDRWYRIGQWRHLVLGLCFLLLPISGFAQAKVVAWGLGLDGQIAVPEEVDAVAVGAGHLHSLVVRADGTVVAFGANAFGQRDVPAGLTGVTAVTGGLFHSLALKSDGTVVAWGGNSDLQTQVPADLGGVTAIAAGAQHSLALKSDGTVVAWGSNLFGQATVPADLAGVIAIAAGRIHSLALKSDGTVVAWGDNGDGELDIPAGLDGVVAIAAGNLLSMALRADGTVVVWGDLDNPRPVPAGLSDVVAIAGGIQHCLALRADGTLVAWGFDSEGQASVPVGLTGVTAIAAGGYHNVALRRALSPALAIRALRDDVDGLGVATGNALRMKLNAALAALAAANPRHTCQSLQDFSHMVSAQRGHQLTVEQADYLLAQAADIRLLVGCR